MEEGEIKKKEEEGKVVAVHVAKKKNELIRGDTEFKEEKREKREKKKEKRKAKGKEKDRVTRVKRGLAQIKKKT